MTKRLRLTPLFFTTLFFLLLSVPYAAHAQETVPFYEASDCLFDDGLPIMTPEQLGFECGYVTVPELHGEDNGRTIRLPVAIKRPVVISADTEIQDAPLFLAQGGPGGSAFEIFALLASGSPVGANRDIVIFNQRGTKYAEPDLTCTEVQDLTIELLESADSDASYEKVEQATRECHARHLANGINLSAYNSLENAADVDAIRQALGYEQINFYGVSYGTLLGLHLMNHHPEGLRSVILDAVVPTQTNFLPNIGQVTERIYSELFAYCANNPACVADYPNLESRTFALIDKLNAEPITVRIEGDEAGQSADAILTGDVLADLLFQSFYVPNMYAAFPKIIADLESGDTSFLEFLWPQFAFDDSFSDGMYYSVICAEDADFSAETIPLDGIRPELVDGIVNEMEQFLEVCELWDVDELASDIDTPVSSAVPTLLLSGNFDPITPPAYADTAAATLQNSTHIVDPSSAHGTAFINRCPTSIMVDFLNDPTTAPDTSCATDASHPEAIELADPVPNDVIKLPIISDVNALSSTLYVPVAIFSVALLLLSTAWFTYIVVWIVRKIAKRENVRESGVNRRRWALRIIGMLFPILLIAFLVGFGFALASTSLATITISAISASARPLFIMPLILLVLAIAMLIIYVRGWRGWSGGGKVYYGLLTLSAVAIVVVLGMWGMLTAILA